MQDVCIDSSQVAIYTVDLCLEGITNSAFSGIQLCLQSQQFSLQGSLLSFQSSDLCSSLCLQLCFYNSVLCSNFQLNLCLQSLQLCLSLVDLGLILGNDIFQLLLNVILCPFLIPALLFCNHQSSSQSDLNFHRSVLDNQGQVCLNLIIQSLAVCNNHIQHILYIHHQLVCNDGCNLQGIQSFHSGNLCSLKCLLELLSSCVSRLVGHNFLNGSHSFHQVLCSSGNFARGLA